MNDYKTSDIKNKLLSVIAEFFIFAIIVLIPALTIYIDLVILQNNIGEISVTEFTQEGLLLITALIFWYGAFKKAHIRGFLILVAGFFTTLFIREMDVFFDKINHDIWFYTAITVALVCVLYAYFFAKGTTLNAFFRFFNTKSYFLLLIGMIILLIFSRTFGSGNLLWSHILTQEYTFVVKTAVQEGLELLGYCFIFCGTILFKYTDYSLDKK